MKLIPSHVHGMFDYLGGIMLVLLPNLFGFEDVGGAAVFIPRAMGIMVLMQAMFTDFEVGIKRIIPMQTHLVMDYVLSVFLAASPWIFGFHNMEPRVWMPHLIVGLSVLVLSFLTDPTPQRGSTGRMASV
jgi:hypothetical protein